MTTALAPCEQKLDVLTFARPLSVARQHHALAYGMTVLEILRELNIPLDRPLHIELDGDLVPRRLWACKRPRPGQVLAIGVIPRGGGGGAGQDRNKALRTTLMVVVALAAIVVSVASYGILTPYVGPTAALIIGGIAASAVSIGGGLLVNQLLPPRIKSQDAPQLPDATFGITGTRNIPAGLGTPFTRLYGRHQFFPLKAAETDFDIVGNDQFVTEVFGLGYGPLEIPLDKIRLKDTSIFDYRDVQIEVRQGWPSDPPLTLYPSDRANDVFGQLRLTSDTWTVRTSAPDADELAIIVEFPNGIYSTTASGGIGHATVGFAIQYRYIGESEWRGAPVLPPGVVTTWTLYYHYADGRVLDFVDPAGSIIDIFNVPVTTATSTADVVLNEATRTYQRRQYSWPVAIRGTQEVRIIRHGPEDPSGETVTEMYWTALKTVRRVPPLNITGMALIALRMKATDQLSGTVDELSVEATSILPDWDAASGTWITRATRNPASIFRDVLQGSANKRPVPDRLIDLEGLKAWHAENIAAGRTCDYVLDGRTTVREALTTVCAAGRATIGRADMKYGAVRDLLQAYPVQHFTPRNSWGYSGRRLHVDYPHALKVRLAHNEQKDYQPDEIVVYADGYDASSATLFEVIDAPGVVNPDQAYRLGRYHLACIKLRPETHSWNADFENLRCTRGDLVALGHDVIKAGISSGRVRSVVADAITSTAPGSGLSISSAVPIMMEVLDFALLDNTTVTVTRHAVTTVLTEGVHWTAATSNVATAASLAAALDAITGVDVVLGVGSTVMVVNGVVPGTVARLTVDEPLEMEANRKVGFVFRLPGIPSTAEAVVVPGIQTTVTLVAPLPPTQAPAADTLYTFGDFGREVQFLILTGITRGKDHSARLTAVPAAPEVHVADQGPIPPWDPRITLPPVIQRTPARPSVVGIRSDENVLGIGPDGTLQTRVVFTLTYDGGAGMIPPELLEVRFRRAGLLPDSAWTSAPMMPATTEIAVTGVEDAVTYDFRLRSHTHLGRVSEFTEVQHFVVGKSTPPPDVPMVTLNGRRLVWAYPDPPIDLAGFVIRFHRSDRRSWDDAEDAHGGIIPDTISPFEIELGGASTYLVKAVDTSGHVSVNAAALLVNLGDQVVENLIGTFDQRALGWPGDIINGVILNADLRAQSTSLFYGPDESEFWKTAGGAASAGVQSMLRPWAQGFGKAQSTGVAASIFWQERFATLQYRFPVLPETHQAGADIVMGLAVTAESYRVEYQVAGATLFWPAPAAAFWKTDGEPFWGPIGASGGEAWLVFPGRIRGIQRQVYDFRITLQGTGVQSTIAGLSVRLDAPTVEEFFDDFVVPVQGARLPLTKSYRAVDNIAHTFVADGSIAVKLEVEDKGTGAPFLTAGPHLRARDAQLAPTAATVDVRIKGH